MLVKPSTKRNRTNGDEKDRARPLLLLVGLMVAAPAAFASDFVTGVMVGQMLSDDSGSKKVEDTGPESKTVIDYHDGQPVVTKVEAFKSNKWRKLDGPQGGYFVCPVNTVAIREGCVVASMMTGSMALWAV